MKTDRRAELAPLDMIRVETALSRFPVHRLARQGTVPIELREVNEQGEMMLRWEVSHNSKYGQPGPLAYKADTLVVNRRLEEVGRPVPRIIRLGSLKGIAQQLGLGGNTNKVKLVLRQNAFAAITAKIRYRSKNGGERTLESDFTRYSVIFTGEKLPSGVVADAVYLILNDIYMQVLDGAVTRPLDFDYLRDLAPAPQRLYELLSYRMYAALQHRLVAAKLGYGEFCTYAPLMRHCAWDRARVQMAKIHAPHREAGYIAGVAFEATTDREGRPDWTMIYTPGPKAEAEYRAFTQRGRRLVAIEAEPGPEPEPTGLERELIGRGVTPAQAAELVREFSEDRIRAQIGNLDGRRRKVKDAGAWLASAIRAGYAVSAEPVAARAEPVAVPAMDQAERAEQERIKAYWAGLSAADRERIEAAALARAAPEVRAGYEGESDRRVRRLKMAPIRDAYIRGLLKHSPPG